MKKLLRKLFYKKVRDYFCRNEIKQGRILVTWRDVDDMIYGWHLSADEEFDLIKVAQLISIAKQKKLIHILAGKEETHGNQNKSKEG